MKPIIEGLSFSLIYLIYPYVICIRIAFNKKYLLWGVERFECRITYSN